MMSVDFPQTSHFRRTPIKVINFNRVHQHLGAIMSDLSIGRLLMRLMEGEGRYAKPSGAHG